MQGFADLVQKGHENSNFKKRLLMIYSCF